MFISQTDSKYESVKNSYERCFNDIINSKLGRNHYISVRSFDYANNKLEIGLCSYHSDFKSVFFSKQNGDLYITKSESYWAKQVFL